MKKMHKSNSGFTLVELAIVMMIIGLLIGGILKGQELMENARVTSTIAQIQSYEAATTSFRDVYNSLPGDMSNAKDTTVGSTTLPGRLPNCTGAECVNGDGNSIVGTAGTIIVNETSATAETAQFWHHLLLADLISGVTTSGVLAWGETNPAAKIGGGYTIGHGNGTALANSAGGGTATPSGHFLMLRNSLGTTNIAASGQEPLSPVRAEQIDRKMDDGRPGTGYVLGHGHANCFSGDAYDSQNTVKNCNLLFRIQG